MPSVARDPEELKWRVRRRWGSPLKWRCVYCGTKSPRMQVDHFMPFTLGGDSRARNLVPCCPTCNLEKLDRNPAEWMHLVGVPFDHALLLSEIHLERDWRVAPDYVIPITHLDYTAGKQATRPQRKPKPEPLALMVVDDSLDTPSCPSCLVQLEAVGEDDAVHWQCPECGLAQI